MVTLAFKVLNSCFLKRKKNATLKVFAILLALVLVCSKIHSYYSPARVGRVREDNLNAETLGIFFKNLKMMLGGDWGERGYCNLILELADWPLCGDGIEVGEIPIYSFGIADDYDFEAGAGFLGFRVFAFDPTRSYPGNLSENVTFFNQGLRGSVSKSWSHPLYGETHGELFTLPEILKKTHLKKNQKFILKLDCEGCEWSALSLLKHYPEITRRIQQINIEMHFTTSLRVDSLDSHHEIVDTYNLLQKLGFVPWYIFPQGGSRRDRKHTEWILGYGFPQNLCCFEIGFIRNPVRQLRRKNILKHPRIMRRPESFWKWGQLWGSDGVEYISHSELSTKGRGLTVLHYV